MEQVTEELIQSAPLTLKERKHRSRVRRGIHVYLSRYLADFKALDNEAKQVLLQRIPGYEDFGIKEGDLESIDSIDSVDSVVDAIVTHQHAMKIAFYNWSHWIDAGLKIAWSDRADALNERRVPGLYVKIPADLGVDEEVTRNVLRAMSMDWSNMVRLLRQCITRKPKTIDSQVICCFGDERVKIGSQTLRSFNLPFLLRLSLFGENNRKLYDYELVKETKRCSVIHISSMARIQELFTVTEECGCKFEYEDVIISCSGKVNVQDGNKNILGYIVDENRSSVKVQLENNEIVWFDRVMLFYTKKNRQRIITQYWPIRLLINSSNGDSKLTLNRVTFTCDSNKIITSLTS